jgi:hypothetical protein
MKIVLYSLIVKNCKWNKILMNTNWKEQKVDFVVIPHQINLSKKKTKTLL